MTEKVHLAAPQADAPAAGSKTIAAPLYEHDCSHCRYLGNFKSDYRGDELVYDLYHHPATEEHPLAETVIARFGDGGAYYSGLDFAQPYFDLRGRQHPGIPMLVEALRRARGE